MSTLNQDSPRASLVEQRSIDYIPESERHGRLFSQFTLWFGANLQVTAIVTGALAVVLGGDVFWSLIGLLIGQVLGGTIMALHAAQGPKLGLPQMISSRVQFGVYGAVIPIVLVCLMYVGFSASGSVLAGQAVGQLVGVSDSWGILIFAALIVLLTILGYSVNDTVVIFDRLRENLAKYKAMPLREMMNLTTNETLSRTIMTMTTITVTSMIMNITITVMVTSTVAGICHTEIWPPSRPSSRGRCSPRASPRPNGWPSSFHAIVTVKPAAMPDRTPAFVAFFQ